jgi:O-antigen/teichoic acid export membrane protein
MISRSAFFRSGAIVSVGLSVELGSQFARTVALARILGTSEFGIVAAMYALCSIVEMTAAIGLDRYIVYSSKGGEQRALDTAHALAIARGTLTAAVVALLAVPTAAMMGVSQYVSSFVWVAAVPLLRGFAHLGVVQMQREGRFWPSAAAEGIGALLGFAIAIVAAKIIPDHRAGLLALGAQILAAVIATHILARPRPYRVSFDPVRIKDALRFGLPLAVNGLALAIAGQLDRLIVGAWLGVAALGVYSLTISLILQPLGLVGRLATTLFQPTLSATWHSDPRGEFRRLASQIVLASMLIGLAGAATVICLGAPMFRFVFGSRYVVDDAVFVLLGAVVLIRLARVSFNLFGLAIGRTSDLMISNLAGTIGLIFGLIALYEKPIIASAVFGSVVGEVLTFIALKVRLKSVFGGTGQSFRTIVGVSAVPAVLGAWILIEDPVLSLRVYATSIVILPVVLVGGKLSGLVGSFGRRAVQKSPSWLDDAS